MHSQAIELLFISVSVLFILWPLCVLLSRNDNLSNSDLTDDTDNDIRSTSRNLLRYYNAYVGSIIMNIIIEWLLFIRGQTNAYHYRDGLSRGVYSTVLPLTLVIEAFYSGFKVPLYNQVLGMISMLSLVSVAVQQVATQTFNRPLTWSCLTALCTLLSAVYIDHPLVLDKCSIMILICFLMMVFNMMYANIFTTLPQTFSLSEGVIVCQCTMYYCYHLLLLALWYLDKLSWFNIQSYSPPWCGTKVLMVLSVWLLGIVLARDVWLHTSSWLTLSIIIACTAAGVIILNIYDMYAVISYILYDYRVLSLIASWFMVSCVCIGIVYYLNTKGNQTQVTTAIRKYFHAGALLIFMPGILVSPVTMKLASGGAFMAFLIVEYVRYHRLFGPVGAGIDKSLKIFLDGQDKGKLILTHIYLLSGCSLPLWLASTDNLKNTHISLYSGVISLCVGDSFASVIGKRYGKHRYPGSCKTVEGTLAAWLSMTIFIVFLVFIHQYEVSLVSITWKTLAVALVESTTRQVDNLVLPLFAYLLLIV